MLLINCEINLIMTWSEICVLSNDKKAVKLEINDTKPYATVVSLSTQDSLVVSDLRSETKGSRFESGCQLCAEVISLQ